MTVRSKIQEVPLKTERKESAMSYPEALYHGARGEVSASYRAADRKPDVGIGSSVAVRYLATGTSTAGCFGLYRWDAGPQSGGAC
jgi:hypothetical protein